MFCAGVPTTGAFQGLGTAMGRTIVEMGPMNLGSTVPRWGLYICIYIHKHVYYTKGGQTRSNFATQSWRATLAVQPLHVMVRHWVGCVAGLHAIVA